MKQLKAIGLRLLYMLLGSGTTILIFLLLYHPVGIEYDRIAFKPHIPKQVEVVKTEYMTKLITIERPVEIVKYIYVTDNKTTVVPFDNSGDSPEYIKLPINTDTNTPVIVEVLVPVPSLPVIVEVPVEVPTIVVVEVPVPTPDRDNPGQAKVEAKGVGIGKGSSDHPDFQPKK